jgi:metal-sulfur cluster biosynthetic enzyme
MTTPSKVRSALHNVVDPCSAATGIDLDIVEMGLVKSIDIFDDHVRVNMRLTTPACHMVAYFMKEVEREVGQLPGVESVELEADDGLEWTEEMLSDDAKRRREEMLERQRQEYRQHAQKSESRPDVARN